MALLQAWKSRMAARRRKELLLRSRGLAGTPAAVQLAWRVVGSGPLPLWLRSQGSVAKMKKLLDGLKISVIAGARMARV